MTKYFGNIPVVGKKKEVAFKAYCELCKEEHNYIWVNPLGHTLKKTVFARLFSTQSGFSRKGIIYSLHTILLFLKIKKAVEVGKCEKCGTKKIKCRHCGHVDIFEKWKEIYQCCKCQKESYMLADHEIELPPWFFDTDFRSDTEE